MGPHRQYRQIVQHRPPLLNHRRPDLLGELLFRVLRQPFEILTLELEGGDGATIRQAQRMAHQKIVAHPPRGVNRIGQFK